LRSVTFVTKKIRDILDKNEEYDDRTLIVSFSMLRFHTYLLDKLSHSLALKAEGKDDLATEAFETMRREVSKREIYFEHQFDFGYFIEAIRRIIKGKQREDAFSG
jgi:hypothetical protein